MKKFFSLVMLLICLVITGCQKEDDTFKHYDLKDKDIETYVYYSDKRGKETYALSDLTTGDMTITTGFFYKVADDDFILLETLESSHNDAYKNKSIYQFYDNKLYGVGNGNTPMIFEIELKGKESKIKPLEFKIDGKVNPFLTGSIKNIENNSITLSGDIFIGEHSEYRYFECSLENYKCSIKDSN